jgi:hypothetical protein
MGYRDEEETHKRSISWTTDELVRYCRTNLNDAKALEKVGLSHHDAQTYIKLYPNVK